MFPPNRGREILYRGSSFLLHYAQSFRHVIDIIIFAHRKPKNGSIFFLLYLLTCLNTPVQAGQNSKFSISLWPISERLSQGTIRSTIDGKDGMLWIAALDGINRYDGNNIFEFRTYKTNEGFIESSNMLAIIEGVSGEIFASTRDAGILVSMHNSTLLHHSDGMRPTQLLMRIFLPCSLMTIAYFGWGMRMDKFPALIIGWKQSHTFSLRHLPE